MFTANAIETVLNNMLAAAAVKGNRAEQDQSRLALVKASAEATAATPKVKVRKVKGSEETDPASNGEQAMVAKPIPIDLDAKKFLALLRNAGKREIEGRLVFDSLEVRNDTIALIARYVGYDPNGSYGSQELSARTKAIRELRGGPFQGGPTLAEVRRTKATISGYVAGIPDALASKVDDLKGRERIVVEQLLHFEKDATVVDDSQRGIVLARAQVERERLGAIRADLDGLLGKR